MKQITTAAMPIAQCAINKFMFFSWNYPSKFYEWTDEWGRKRGEILPTFLWECKDRWECNFSHMVGKWHDACDSGSSYATIPRFYGLIGTESRRIMLEWICRNYNDEQSI